MNGLQNLLKPLSKNLLVCEPGLKEAKTEKKNFSMKKWDTNELRQPTSWLAAWFMTSLKWTV